jgi:hypothetical protein
MSQDAASYFCGVTIIATFKIGECILPNELDSFNLMGLEDLDERRP